MTQRLECPIALAAMQTPNSVAADLGATQLTYAQLDQQIADWVRVLAEQDVSSGDRIAFQQSDRWSAISLFWAILRRNAIACPISNRLPAEAARQQAAQVGADRILCDGDLPPHRELPHRSAAPQTSSLATPSRNNGLPTLPLDLPATIFFSTGSSGQPKPIVHDFRAHYLSALGSATNLPLTSSDRWFVSLPVYHVGGLSIAIRSAFAGAALVLPTGKTDDLNQIIVDRQVSHVSLVATQLKRWLRNRVDPRTRPFLRAVLLGGGSWPTELIADARREGLPLHTTYGLTEMASQVTTTPAGLSFQHPSSSGRVLPHRELTIDSRGEILVRGKTLCLGYLQDGRIVPVVDQQGWFATGDLGTLNEEGLLTVTGRRDHRFISGGENIHPEEIEAALLAQPGVAQAIVVPVADDQFGQRPVAFVQSDASATKDLRSALAKSLPKFKIPDILWPWPAELPQAGIKPNRREFQELAERRHVG